MLAVNNLFEKILTSVRELLGIKTSLTLLV